MLRFAANLSLLYLDRPFAQRFEAAAEDGFAGVECLFPYALPASEMAARLRDHGLQQVLFNAPPGPGGGAGAEADWAAGWRGMAALPGHEAHFRAGFTEALHRAQALQCPRIHAMAGVLPPQADRTLAAHTYQANLRWAAGQAAPAGVDVLIEPLNPRDMPGYALHRQQAAHALIEAIGAPNLKVQMDLYHAQIVEGDLSMTLRQVLPTGRVGHLQIAGVPERHEPDVGELNYPYLLALIDELGWPGWIGCEYRPARGGAPGGTRAGLGWLRRWQARASGAGDGHDAPPA